MPPCQGGDKIQGCTREGSVGGGMPGRGGADNSVVAATGRGWGQSSLPSARRDLQPFLCGPTGAAQQDSRWGATTSQTVASAQTKTSILRRSISLYSQALKHEAYIGSGANGKRYRRHQPASCPEGQLAGTYPYNSKQSIPAPLRVIRLQLRCNPDSRKSVRTRFFPSISQFGGADGDAPV
jgi:hypothetical protein